MIKEILIKTGLNIAGKKLDGKKTIIGGVGKILTGLGMLFSALIGCISIMFPDFKDFPDIGVEAIIGLFGGGIAMISAGFSTLGEGGKMEKQTAAIKEQTAEITKQTEVIQKKNDGDLPYSPKNND